MTGGRSLRYGLIFGSCNSYTNEGGRRISGRSVFVRDETEPTAGNSLFTTASKPIQNTKNLAMQVEKTRFRFQEVLASTNGKTMRFRRWVLFEYESDFLCLLRFALNEWNPQYNEWKQLSTSPKQRNNFQWSCFNILYIHIYRRFTE